jgi:hypothetical protein
MCNAQAHVRFTPERDIKCDIMESHVRFNLEIGLPPIIAIIGDNKCPHEELAWLVLIHDCERHVDLMFVAGA